MNLSNYLEKGYSYSDYLTKVEKTFQELEESGDEKGFAQYYSMNLKRIDRLNKTFELSEAQKEQLKSVNTNFSLLVISEGWCGDAAQSMPIVNKIMEELGVTQKILFRDENPELMDAYLTDGARSIPMYVGVDANGKELFRFGPRPKAGMDMLDKHKSDPESYTADEFHKDLQVWYNQDKGESTFNELLQILTSK